MMWNISLKGIPFEADVRELLMAFYPDGSGIEVHGEVIDGRYCFKIKYIDSNDKTLLSFILNSKDTIRKDPFFYKCNVELLNASIIDSLSVLIVRMCPISSSSSRPNEVMSYSIFLKAFLSLL